MLQRQGHHVEVMAFERDFHHGRSPGWPVTTLGRIRHESYLRRLPALIRSVPKIRSGIRRNQLVYAFNADLAFTALISGLGLGKPIILDVQDIRAIQVARGLKGRMFRRLDKFIVDRCRLLILLTSRYRRYYRDWLNTNTPDIVIDQRVESSRITAHEEDESPAAPGVPLDGRPLRIGYFSVIRDPWSLQFLECLSVSSKERFEVVLAGAVSPKIRGFERFLERNPAIEYKGRFRNPDDIPELYGSVDMILACYSPAVPDCWSQSARFYQSCLFRKPLIVRAGTGDADEVDRHQIGLVLSESRPEDAARELGAVTADDWVRWRTNMARLPRHVYSHTGEADELIAALNGLLA